MQVNVLTDGTMQLIDGQMSWAPLTIAQVQALNAQIGAAQNAQSKLTMTQSMQWLVTNLSLASASMKVTTVATQTAINVTADPSTFAQMQQALGQVPATPLPVGSPPAPLTYGPVTIVQG